jgi:hypothetical protein
VNWGRQTTTVRYFVFCKTSLREFFFSLQFHLLFFMQSLNSMKLPGKLLVPCRRIFIYCACPRSSAFAHRLACLVGYYATYCQVWRFQHHTTWLESIHHTDNKSTTAYATITRKLLIRLLISQVHVFINYGVVRGNSLPWPVIFS